MEHLVLSCLESRIERNRSLYARFLLGPFQNGHALTIATSLRRALLSEIEGVAILALDIQGVTHEFSTIAGVRESVLELSLNFQEVVLRQQIEWEDKSLRAHLRSPATQIGYLQMQGPAVVYANDLQLPLGVECVDPAQHIATLSSDGILVVKFLIGKRSKRDPLKRGHNLLTCYQIKQGRKALQGQAFKSHICLQNMIPLDAFSAPVTRVNFVVETDHLSNKKRERVLLELWTNGSVHPRQAIHQGVLALLRLFSTFRRMTHLDSHSVSFADQALQPTQTEKMVDSKSNVLARSRLLQIRDVMSQTRNRRPLASPASNLTRTWEYGDVRNRLLSLYKSNLDKMSLLASDVSNLSLALNTYVVLKRKGVNRLHDILEHSPKALLRLVNGDKGMLYDIRRCVMRLGLQLKD